MTTATTTQTTRTCIECLTQTTGAAMCPTCLANDRAQVVEEHLGCSVTKGQLSDAFDAVANPQDWRAPILAWIWLGDLGLTRKAVAFYTATELRTTGQERRVNGRTEVEVAAAGYRAGPAGC